MADQSTTDEPLIDLASTTNVPDDESTPEAASTGRENNQIRYLEWFKAIILPLTIAILGFWYQRFASEQTVRAQYVEIAVDIISNPLPSEEVSDEQQRAQAALREWAVDILASQSPEPLTDDLQRQLQSGEVDLPSAPTTIPAVIVDVSDCRIVISTDTLVLAEPSQAAEIVSWQSGTYSSTRRADVGADRFYRVESSGQIGWVLETGRQQRRGSCEGVPAIRAGATP